MLHLYSANFKKKKNMILAFIDETLPLQFVPGANIS